MLITRASLQVIDPVQIKEETTRCVKDVGVLGWSTRVGYRGGVPGWGTRVEYRGRVLGTRMQR